MPLKVTKCFDRQHHVDMLLLAEDDKRHYILIKNLPGLFNDKSQPARMLVFRAVTVSEDAPTAAVFRETYQGLQKTYPTGRAIPETRGRGYGSNRERWQRGRIL